MEANLFGWMADDTEDVTIPESIESFSIESELSAGERWAVSDSMKRMALKMWDDDRRKSERLFIEADRYCNCGHEAVGMYCERDNSEYFIKTRCRSRICEYCGAIYKKRLMKRLLPPIQKAVAQKRRGYVLAMLTLTVRTTRWGDGMPGRSDIKRLYRETSDFLRLNYGKYAGKWTKKGKIREDRKRFIGAGWIASIEVGADNNNAHCHAIIYGPLRQWHKLASAWEKITGDSMSFKIEQIRSPRHAAGYVMKYITKPPKTQDYSRIAEYAVMVKGTRRLRTGGIFFRLAKEVKEERRICCAICGHRLSFEGVIDLADCAHRRDVHKELREIRQLKETTPKPPPFIIETGPRVGMPYDLPF